VPLPFKKASYSAPPDRSHGPAPKRPRAETIPSETGTPIIFNVTVPISVVFRPACPRSEPIQPLLLFRQILGGVPVRSGKYSANSLSALAHIASLPPGIDASLVSAAYSESSWKRSNAALNSFKRFATDSGSMLVWPFSTDIVNNFVSWALKKPKLSPSTVNVYLSDIATCHKLKGLDPSACSNFFAKTMLKGAKNLASYSATQKEPTAVMTLSS
jgi:hypothetical protein